MIQFGRAKPLNLTTLTHFELFFQWPKAPKKEPKSLPKWSLWAPKITEKTEKQTLKKHTKKWMQKLSKKEPKRTTPFARKSLQNHKNPSLGLKMCPKPPGGVPRHQKYSKIIKK